MPKVVVEDAEVLCVTGKAGEDRADDNPHADGEVVAEDVQVFVNGEYCEDRAGDKAHADGEVGFSLALLVFCTLLSE